MKFEPGDVILHYEIRGRVGQGGMGEVFGAFGTRMQREVALPVDDATFAMCLRQFAYDRSPLNAVIEDERDEELAVRQVVTLDAAYCGERMRAVVLVPKTAAPPFQVVVSFPGSNAIHSRFACNVLLVAGLLFQRSLPEVDAFHYASRVTQPTLMLNGEYDFFFPLETAQKPLFAQLGSPPEHKRYMVYPGAHSVPRTELVKEMLGWLDKYLGPVRR